MKFGVITYARTEDVNIGDSMMSLGVRAIYKKMGIAEEDIVPIYFGQNVEKDYEYDFLNYQGDYVLLPMAMSMDYDLYRKTIFPLSPKIIPVFVGFTCISRNGYVRCLSNYKQFGPFGCRDIQTMYGARQEGLDAYMLGCLSIQSVEKREVQEDTQTKCYLVNAPEKIKEYMPSELLENIVEVNHHKVVKVDKKLGGKELAKVELEAAKKLLKEYRDNAAIVITSRLHCALPCISMGIPTIVIRHEDKRREMDFFDHRFSGLDKLMNIYDYDEFEKIDWNPVVPDIEEFKEKQLNAVIGMIKRIYDKYSPLCEISDFFENRNERVYYSGVALGYLSTRQKEKYIRRETRFSNLFELIINKYLYSTSLIIYGAGDKGRWTYWQFENEIHMAKECIYVDGNRNKWGGKLNGIDIAAPEVIHEYKKKGNLTIIVAINHSYDFMAQEIAKKLNVEFGLIEGKDFFMLDKLMESARYQIADFSMIRPASADVIWT